MKPNILFVLIDQGRFDAFGFVGNAQIQTPHLDALANDGVLFSNGFCPFPVCTPSRYSLLSGLYVHQHGGASNKCTLAPHLPTFPKILREAGYQTRAVGKMHFTPTYLDTGFDYLELAEQDGDGRLDDDYHRELRAHDLADGLDIQDQRAEIRARAPQDYWDSFGAQVSDLPEKWHSTTWIADRALAALQSWDKSGGNLLMASFIKPHHPFDPPAEWATRYNPDEMEILPGWTPELCGRDALFDGYFPYGNLTEAATKRATAFYYATLSHIDHHVGRLISDLKSRGLYEDTLVVFTADHGEYLGFHHLLLKGGPMYDPLLRVPLVLKFPGGARGAQNSEVLSTNVDLAPTILRCAGLAPPAMMSGIDLFDATSRRDFVFAQGMGRRFMARSQIHKLLLGPKPEDNAFFNLETDPLEHTDLFHEPDNQADVAELRRALSDWLMFEAPVPIVLDEGAPQIQTPQKLAQLRAERPEMLAYFQRKYAESGRQ